MLTGHFKFKMCRSTRLQGSQTQGVGIDRVFWENVPNLVDIKREFSRGWAEAVAATQHMTSNNLHAFREDTRFNIRTGNITQSEN